MRTIPALVITAAALATGLTGCSAPAACTPAAAQGGAADLVDVSGDFGGRTEVEFPTPLVVDETTVTEVDPGDGRTLRDGDVVDFQVTVLLGEAGQTVTTSSFDPEQPIRRTVGADTDVFGAALECATVGSRVVAVTTVADVYGEDALSPELGLANEDALVLVMDVQRGFPGRADGANQLAVPGMPAVVRAPDGTPGITLPNEEPPTELRIATLKQGDGATVEEGDRVVVHYTGLIWETESIFQSTWDTTAATLTAAVSEDGTSAGVIPGMAEALIGSEVGSQFIVVIPPEYGYPDGASPAGIPEDSTLVFVVDVLGIE